MRQTASLRGRQLWPDPLVDYPRLSRLKKTVDWLLVVYIVVVAVFAATSARPDIGAGAALASLFATAGLLAVGAWPGGRALALGGALLAAALSAVGAPTPVSVLSVIVFSLVAAQTTRSLLWILPLVAVTYVVVMWLSGRAVAAAVDDAVLTLAPALGASVFLTSIIRNVGRVDQLHEDRVRTELADSFDLAARSATQAARQLLHDRVLAALSSVVDRHDAQEARVIWYCEQVADEIEGRHNEDEAAGGGTSLRSIVSAACREVPVDVQVQLGSRGADDPLPVETAAALRRAVGEALRNCARHSGARSVTIRHESAGSHSTLVVADRGQGFAHPSAGWGIANSIREPMLGIGGAALIHSKPDEGTTVTLTWPRLPQEAGTSRLQTTYQETREAVGDIPVLALVAVPLLLSNTYIAIRYSIGDTTALPQIALAVGSSIVTYLLLRRLLHDGPTLVTISGIAASSLLTVVLGLSLAEPADALRTYDSWCVGLAAIGPFVLAFYLTPAWWPLVVLPNAAIVILAAQREPTLEITDAFGAINAAVLPVYALACGVAIRATERQVRREVASLAEASHKLGRSQPTREQQAQERFLTSRAAPWLRKVASGEVRVGQPDTSAEAGVLAQEARDALNLPGVLDNPLRDRISALRRQGTSVVLVAGDSDHGHHQLALRLLDRTLDEAPRLSSIVLYFAEAGTTTLTTTPELPQNALPRVLACLHDVAHRVENDGLTTTITVSATTEIP